MIKNVKQNHLSSWKKTARLALITPFVLAAPATFAQDVGFADDFTADSISFSSGSFGDAIGDATITPTAEGLRLDVTASDPMAPGSLFIETQRPGDKFGIEITPLTESSLDQNAFGNVFLETFLYSEISPDSPGYTDFVGAVEAEIILGFGADGQASVNFCLQRISDSGDQEVVNNICGNFPGVVPVLDERASMSIELNRAESQVVFAVNGQTQSFDVPEVIYPLPRESKSIQLFISSNPEIPTTTESLAAAVLQSITIDDEIIDAVTNPPIIGRYRLDNFNQPGKTATIVDNMLRIATIARTDDDWNGVHVNIENPTDYLEATQLISSESVLGTDRDGNINSRIETRLYNDQAEGGNGTYLGDVIAELQVRLRADGRRQLEYCLFRRTNDEGSESEGILDDGDFCNDLALVPEFDIPIRTSIGLDREAGTITFRADNQIYVQSLAGPFFEPMNRNASITVNGGVGSDPVVLIDTVRTAADATTATEDAAGATAEAFPEPGEPPTGDSTILNPLAATTPTLDFIDDFSIDTSGYAFDTDNDRGVYGIAVTGGAAQLEAASTDPEDCCASARIRLSNSTDFLAAKVSLSSDSSIPPGRFSRAMVRVSGQFYNEIADGGLEGAADERAGDVFVQNRIYLENDGRRRAQACVDRRLEDSSNQGVDLFDGDNCIVFDAIPELDTIYELSIDLDRENSMLTLGFDGDSIDAQMVTVPITGAFTPARPGQEVQVQHEGNGRAVGKIHSITTDQFDQDFATNPPIFPPYRPVFGARNEGVDVATVDGRLSIVIDGTVESESRDIRYVSRSPAEYISAIVNISAESVAGEDFFQVGIGGHMYNDMAEGGLPDTEEGDTNNEGAVFGTLIAMFKADGENRFQYCAIRSNDTNFSSTTDLISGVVDPEICLSLGPVPEFDTDYLLTMRLDRELGQIVYSIDDVTETYQITTDVFTPGSFFQGVRAIGVADGKIVAFADDLSFSPNPVPLSESATLIGFVESSDEMGGGDTGAGTDAGGITDMVTEVASSGGGGGCSVGGTGGLQAPMLLIAFMALLRIRRRK